MEKFSELKRDIAIGIVEKEQETISWNVGVCLCRPVRSLSQRGVPLIEDAQFSVWCINITSAMLSILGERERSH